jgi:hypothetical protein
MTGLNQRQGIAHARCVHQDIVVRRQSTNADEIPIDNNAPKRSNAAEIDERRHRLDAARQFDDYIGATSHDPRRGTVGPQ